MPTAFDDLLTDTPPQAAAEDFSDLLTDEPPAPPQSPLETGVRAAAQAPGQSVMSAYSGVGRAAENFGDTLGQTLPGPLGPIAKGYFKAITTVPRYLGPIAKDIANESQRVYNPDSQRNPKSAAVGSGIGQALPMAGTALIAGPAGPLALAAGQGADQGIDQAEQMGITDPAKKLAMGTAYGGVELLTEKLGGFGSKAFTAPVKRTLGQMFKEGVKTVAFEAIEEPIAGIAQDAIATGFAPAGYDTRDLRPFVMSPSGVPVPNPSYINRRGLETLGGAAGGVAGAAVQMLANRATPAAPEAPTIEGDPLAAFAATMPETVQGSPFPVPGSTDTGPEAWAEMLTNEGPPLEGQPIDWSDIVTDAPPSSPVADGVSLPPERSRDSATAPLASVTPPASPVPTPAAAAEAPVVPTTDAGSTPAAGTPFTGNTRTRQTPVIPDAPYGGRDVLDFLNDNTITLPPDVLAYVNEKKGAKLNKQGRGGDYDFLEKYTVPQGFRKYLFSEADTGNINEVAQMAHDEGLISDPTPDVLMGAVLDTIEARESYTRQVNAREQQLAEEEKALLQWEEEQGISAQAVAWAEQVIKESESTPFLGIDPRLMAAYTIKGADIIARGVSDFAQWSADMIREFGEILRPHLQDIWNGAQEANQPVAKWSERDNITNDFVGESGWQSFRDAISVVDPGAGKANDGIPRQATDASTKDAELATLWQTGWRSEALTAPTDKGGEHQIEFRGTRVYKETHPETFGARFDPAKPEALQWGTPLQYLSRWRLFNELFPGANVKFHGVVMHPDGSLSMQISQPILNGPHPEDATINSTLTRAGWKSEGSTTWTKTTDRGVLRMTDAKKANFIMTEDGTLVPVDVILDLQPKPIGFKNTKLKKRPGGFVRLPEIKLTHAAVAESRQAEGKAPLPTGGQGTVEQWQQEAAARVQQPGAATALVTDILNQQRPATPVEHYMLMNYAAALDAQLDEANAALSDPAASPDARAAAAAQRGTLDAARDNVARAQQIAGSKAGAALGARARGIERGVVPSLSKMVADISIIQDPTGRTPLPPEERAVIEQTHAKMVEAEAAAQQHEAQGSQTDLHTELQKLLEEAQQQIAAQKTQLEAQEHALNVQPGKLRIYTKSKVKLKEWSDDGRAAREELLKMIGVQVNASFGIEMLPQVARMVRGFMADGFLTADAVAKKLVKAVPPEFYNSLKNFLPQIMDAADKLGREDAKIQTPDDIKAKARKQVLANDGGLPRSTARQIALAHITDHLVRGDKTLSAAKIAKLVQQDLEEFQPGITEREARDLISGYGQSSFPSKDEARATLRDLAAQMQKLTQLEALKNRERLLKSGPQRDKASAELRELQKQVEDLKKDIGYKGTTREDELKSIRDRIQTHLENQIEELQRVIAGKARPTGPREAVIYDQELQRLKELRDTLREQVAEMPEHKLATEERRNKAAMKSAQKSEAEWNRRAKAMQWKKPGKPPAAFTAEVEAARAKAKEARANFEALKKTADPRNDPEVRTLRDFKRRTQLQIDAINDRIAKGDFEPKKRTPRQVKHDAESDKLRHALAQRKRDWIDLKLQHKYQMMGLAAGSSRWLLKVYNTSRAIMTGGEFSGILRQGFFKLVSRPGRVLAGDIPAMLRAFRSEQGEFSLLNSLQMRPNGITGRYKEAKLALHNPHDYSSMIAEGNYRTAWANKIPFIAGTGRAYTALLAHMRADLFDMMTEKLEAANNSQPLTTRELEAIGEFVNDSTGAGKLGFGNNQIRSGEAKELLGAAIFSPAFVASRFRLLFGASLWGGTLRTREAIAGEYLRMAAGTAAVYALLSALSDPDDDRDRFDPKSSNFLKLQFGKTKLDIMAGLNQTAVLLAREWMGQITRKGKTTPIRGEGVPFGGTTATDVAVNFLRSKASPAASFAWNRLSGTDYSGNPATLKHDLLQFTLPITADSIADIVRTEPLQRAIPLSAAAYFGFGTQTRTAEDAARRR